MTTNEGVFSVKKTPSPKGVFGDGCFSQNALSPSASPKCSETPTWQGLVTDHRNEIMRHQNPLLVMRLPPYRGSVTKGTITEGFTPGEYAEV